MIEETVTELELERVGRITLKRVIDFDALTEGNDPETKISIATVKEAGTYAVSIIPNGRNAKPVIRTMASKVAGLAYIQGVQDLHTMKKKGPRKTKGKADTKTENGATAAAAKPAKPKASKPKSANA